MPARAYDVWDLGFITLDEMTPEQARGLTAGHVGTRGGDDDDPTPDDGSSATTVVA